MVTGLLILVQFLRRARQVLRNPELRGMMVFVLLILCLGAIFYHNIEGWSWLDSFYFTVITLTTIGYGDFVPKTDVGKFFTMVYVFIGLGLLAVFISSVAEFTLSEQRKRNATNPDQERVEEPRDNGSSLEN